MNIGDLVREIESENNLGIIIEIIENTFKSGSIYKSYMIHWLKTGFKSTHGLDQLMLLNKHFAN